MNIKIAYLYPDLMNLYGDIGNVKALENAFKDQKIKVLVYPLTIEDKIDFNDYDIFYMGSGTESNQKIVINDLLKYRNDIKEAINNHKFFFITGNALEIFGGYIKDKKEKYECLNIFNYYTETLDKPVVCETLAKTKLIKGKILGFQNRRSEIINLENNYLFDVIYGVGCNSSSNKEGIIFNNFIGTYIIGPILVRNPMLLKHYVEKVIKFKSEKFKVKKFDFKLENKAYNEFMKFRYDKEKVQ